MTVPPFSAELRTRVLFGPGRLQELSVVAGQLKAHRILLVTDHGLETVGHPQRAEQFLRAQGFPVIVFDDVHPNPTTEDVNRGLEVARQAPIDLIVGLGGGSSLDCAKGINFLLTNGGSMEDYQGYHKATRPMLPMIAVPTTAGTGSEAQSYAIIARAQDHMKMACGDPQAACHTAILDPELTLSLPPSVTAATGMDALSHALESHVTQRRNPFSALFSRAAWNHLAQAFPRVLAQPDDLDARGAMMLGANWAGTAIEHSMLGAVHALANPLSAHLEMTHGHAISIMLPHVLRFNAAVAASEYALLARDCGLSFPTDADAGVALADFIQDLCQQGGLPQSLPSTAESLIPVLADEASQQWTGKFNPRPVSRPEFEELYACALA